MLDLAIIGGGPTGLSAAIYAARAGLKVQVFEKADLGGLLPTIAQIENYPGFFGEGRLLAEQMRRQAEQSGARLSYGECTDIMKTDFGYSLTIDGEEFSSRTVIFAAGSRPKQLSFDLGVPVSYCALCDGPLAKDKRVAVIGGANSAAQEALYLSSLASQVDLITHSAFKADQGLIDRVAATPNITVYEHLEPTPELLNQYDFCFVYIGKLPATDCLAHLAEVYAILSRSGYLCSDENSPDYPHMTVVPGLFAAGDVRDGATKQVVVAAADGAEAAIEAVNLLKMQK